MPSGSANGWRTWLGDENQRLRAGAVEITREQSYGILQDALRNYALWVDSASDVTFWSPGPSPKPDLGNPGRLMPANRILLPE